MSKLFPFTGWGGGGSLDKKCFFQSEHVSSQIWCQKFFPLLRPGTPPQTWTWDPPYPDLDLGPPHPDLALGPSHPPTLTWTWDPPTWTWTWDPPYSDLDLGPPHPDLDLGPPLPGPGLGTPPLTWTWDPPHPDLDLGPPPPPVEVWTDKLKTVPSPILRMRAVKIKVSLFRAIHSYWSRQERGPATGTQAKRAGLCVCLLWLIHIHGDLSRGWGPVPEMGYSSQLGTGICHCFGPV